MIRALLLALLVITPALAEPVPPTYHRVTGVAADDTLSVRAGPGASFDRITTLPPGAFPVEVTETNPAGTWGRVALLGSDGWVSMRYLELYEPDWLMDTGAGRATGIPIGLSCYGTEPFWNLTVESPTRIMLGLDPSEETVPFGIGRVSIAVGYLHMPAGMIATGPEGVDASISIHAGQCTDGMSDSRFGLVGSAWVVDDTGARLFSGCCTLRQAD